MKKLLMVLMLCLVSMSSWANDSDELERLLGVEADVKVTLGPGMLGLANLLAKDEPEAKAVLSGLKNLTINVFELKDDLANEDVRDWMNKKVNKLAKNGVEEIVRVADGDERVHILAKVEGKVLSDISILVYEPGDEFVYLTIGGFIDAANLKQVTGNFDIDINGLQALNLSL